MVLFSPPFVVSSADYSPPPRTIKHYAHLFDVDFDLALAIAKCESRLDASAKNPYSSAKGVFQFLDSTWKHYALKHWHTLAGHDVLNYGDNVELGLWVLGTYGTSDWQESTACWGKSVP